MMGKDEGWRVGLTFVGRALLTPQMLFREF